MSLKFDNGIDGMNGELEKDILTDISIRRFEYFLLRSWPPKTSH